MTGPHFDMGPPLEDEKGRKHWDPKPCICGLTTYVDAATGLCRECWRAWRFSALARQPDDTATIQAAIDKLASQPQGIVVPEESIWRPEKS